MNRSEITRTVGAVCLLGAAGYLGKTLYEGRTLAQLAMAERVALASAGVLGSALILRRSPAPRARQQQPEHVVLVHYSESMRDLLGMERRLPPLPGSTRATPTKTWNRDEVLPAMDGIRFEDLDLRNPQPGASALLILDSTKGLPRAAFSQRHGVVFDGTALDLTTAAWGPERAAAEFGHHILWVVQCDPIAEDSSDRPAELAGFTPLPRRPRTTHAVGIQVPEGLELKASAWSQAIKHLMGMHKGRFTQPTVPADRR